ncbi:hypothetical protein Tco_0581318, partial [Tanacetum coccineum]
IMAIDDNINMSGDDATKKHDDIGFSSELNLSFGDTLYLHPNDTSGSSIVTISPGLFTGAIYAKTTFDMWSDLKETYEKVDGSPVFNLHKMVKNHIGMSLLLGPLNLLQLLLQLKPLTIRGGQTITVILTKIGHTVDRCFELVGYPAGYVKSNFNSSTRHVSSNNASVDGHSNCAGSNNATTNISPVSLSNEQLSRLMNLLNDNGVSFANANMAGADQHMTVSAKFLVNVVDISNLGLIHQRLGHSADQVLDVLKYTLNLDSQSVSSVILVIKLNKKESHFH